MLDSPTRLPRAAFRISLPPGLLALPGSQKSTGTGYNATIGLLIAASS